MSEETTAPAAPAAAVAPAGPAAPAAAPAAATTPAAPAAPAADAPKAPVSFSPEQQAAINDIIAARLEKAATKAEKTLEERVAEIEKVSRDAVTAAETTAINAIVEKAAASAHNPALVRAAVNLDGLTASNTAEITQRVEQFLTENPYLVKQASGPDLTPAPGAGSAATGARLLTKSECDALSASDLADPATMELYLKSQATLRKSA